MLDQKNYEFDLKGELKRLSENVVLKDLLRVMEEQALNKFKSLSPSDTETMIALNIELRVIRKFKQSLSNN